MKRIQMIKTGAPLLLLTAAIGCAAPADDDEPVDMGEMADVEEAAGDAAEDYVAEGAADEGYAAEEYAEEAAEAAEGAMAEPVPGDTDVEEWDPEAEEEAQ